MFQKHKKVQIQLPQFEHSMRWRLPKIETRSEIYIYIIHTFISDFCLPCLKTNAHLISDTHMLCMVPKGEIIAANASQIF